MIIGYLRVSRDEQRPDRQIDGIAEICDKLVIEKLSAVAKKRPKFEKIIRELKRGDTFVVWDLDRAFRSTVEAILTAEKLRERGVNFRILNLNVDTATANGRLVYNVLAAFAEHERDRLSERTKEGLAAARKRGKRLGRPPKLTRIQIAAAQKILENDRSALANLAIMYGVHPSTLRRALRLS